jgi:putative chitobiose transport system substrate-binding protein
MGKKNENEELVFWTLQLGSFDKYINKIIYNFEKENPDIKIKWVDVPYAEGEKRTLAALLSDNPPDLINLTPDFSAMAAQKNALFEIPKDFMKQYPESLYPALSYNGKFFAIPFYLTSAITFANQDLLQKADIYKIPKSYDTMFDFAKQTKDKTGMFIEMPTLNENDTFIKILNKYGVNILLTPNFDKAKQIFKRYEYLYKSDLIPKESLTQSHREALEKYMSGQVVFLQAGANFLNIIRENAPEMYDKTVLFPQMTGDSGKYDFSLMNLIIPANSKKHEQALKFAEYLTNQQNQLELAKLTSVLPANKYALQDSYFNKSGNKEELARKISSEQIKNVSTEVKNTRNKKNIILLTNTILAQILTDKISLNEGMREFEMKYYKLKD